VCLCLRVHVQEHHFQRLFYMVIFLFLWGIPDFYQENLVVLGSESCISVMSREETVAFTFIRKRSVAESIIAASCKPQQQFHFERNI
jgi:hypothetical protein